MKNRVCLYLILPLLSFLSHGTCSAQVERIWLTSKSKNARSVVVNWETVRPGDSVVSYGKKGGDQATLKISGNTNLHQVEIPISDTIETYHYRVSTGDQKSDNSTFTVNPKDELRVAVVANWHQKPNLDAILKDDIHLLLTAGDIVPALHHSGEAGKKDWLKPYRKLIDAYPALFRSTIFMPVLGNHDREIRPRGSSPPAKPVYDVDATAFRRFFPLPDEGWKWTYAISAFDVEFVALDLNHISDHGTTWQSCHPYHQASQQFKWYRKLMADSKQKYVVTLFNEKNESMRNQEDGDWHRMFSKGSAVISGYGYFGERAEKDGVPYLNTSLNGTGDKYPDSGSKVFKSEDNYLLLTFRRKSDMMKIEMKNLAGKVLDKSEWPARQ